jgi:signal transduction histidine kinase
MKTIRLHREPRTADPLTSIAGSLGLLRGGAAGELPERATKLVSIAHSNSERLVRLINDILDIEKIESGKLTFDMLPVDLRQVLSLALEANRGFAERYGVRLEISSAPEKAIVSADADRLMQVLTNLISNAVKFSPSEGTVSTSIRRHGDHYRISVADRGAAYQRISRAASSPNSRKRMHLQRGKKAARASASASCARSLPGWRLGRLRRSSGGGTCSMSTCQRRTKAPTL